MCSKSLDILTVRFARECLLSVESAAVAAAAPPATEPAVVRVEHKPRQEYADFEKILYGQAEAVLGGISARFFFKFRDG